MGLATRCETRTTILRANLHKPASEKEVVTTKKQPLAQRPLLQDNLTQGQRGETNANLPAPITQLPVTHSNAAPRLVQTLRESMEGTSVPKLLNASVDVKVSKQHKPNLHTASHLHSTFSVTQSDVQLSCLLSAFSALLTLSQESKVKLEKPS